MNKSFLKTMIFGAALLLAAACSQNDFSGSQGEPLPEGRYPLQISSVTMSVESDSQPWSANAPQTRVAENATDGNSSHWTNGDQIGVKIGTDNTETGVYTVNVDVSGNVTGLTPTTPLYWKSTTPSQTVTAWYPTDATVSLSDQSSSLAYVLAGTGSGNYQNAVSLTFTHALAKVRVKLEGDKATGVTGVHLYTYTSCTNSKGTVSNGATEGWIKMKEVTYNGTTYYEANVVPGYEITKFKINNAIEGTLTTTVTTVAAKLHEIAVTVGLPVTEVNISDISETSYTVSGNVHLKGNGQAKDLKLTVEDGAKLILENVTLQPQTDGAAITCNGNATIILNEENSVSGHGRAQGILVTGGKTLVIKGDGKLVATGSGNESTSVGIGATDNSNITINSGTITAKSTGSGAGIGSAGENRTCGVITINGGTIEARGGAYSAGIGGSNSGSCGDIIIKGGNIRAYGGLQSPSIGNGDSADCGNITISGENTVVYAKKGENGSQKPANSIGWNNYSGKCGEVTIGAECTVTRE